MTTLITVTLVLHVLTGLAAGVAGYVIWTQLLREKFEPRTIRRWAYLGFFNIILSWITAAWYYVQYYGRNVKPLIIDGQYPWAHRFFTEWKEHVFLFLPVLAAVLLFATWKLSPDDPTSQARRKVLIPLAAVYTLIVIALTLSGVFISGAVR